MRINARRGVQCLLRIGVQDRRTTQPSFFFVAERFRIFDHVHLSLGLWHTKFQFGGLFGPDRCFLTLWPLSL